MWPPACRGRGRMPVAGCARERNLSRHGARLCAASSRRPVSNRHNDAPHGPRSREYTSGGHKIAKRYPSRGLGELFAGVCAYCPTAFDNDHIGECSIQVSSTMALQQNAGRTETNVRSAAAKALYRVICSANFRTIRFVLAHLLAPGLLAELEKPLRVFPQHCILFARRPGRAVLTDVVERIADRCRNARRSAYRSPTAASRRRKGRACRG